MNALITDSRPTRAYPETLRVAESDTKKWDVTYRALRTCTYCKRIFRQPHAAYACETSHGVH